MATLKEVTFKNGHTKIGTAFNGVFEKTPQRDFLGLSKIRWLVDDPDDYKNTICSIDGDYVDGGQGKFLNDMKLKNVNEMLGTATFEK